MIPGETSSIQDVSILTESNVGVYRCEVTNSVGLSGSNTTTIELGGEYWQSIPPTFHGVVKALEREKDNSYKSS